MLVLIFSQALNGKLVDAADTIPGKLNSAIYDQKAITTQVTPSLITISVHFLTDTKSDLILETAHNTPGQIIGKPVITSQNITWLEKDEHGYHIRCLSLETDKIDVLHSTKNQISHLRVAETSAQQLEFAWQEKCGQIEVIKYLNHPQNSQAIKISPTDINCYSPTIYLSENGKTKISWIYKMEDSLQLNIIEVN